MEYSFDVFRILGRWTIFSSTLNMLCHCLLTGNMASVVSDDKSLLILWRDPLLYFGSLFLAVCKILFWSLSFNSLMCLGVDLFFFLIKKIFFNIYLLLRDRNRQSMSMGGPETGRDAESEAGSRLGAVSTGPDVGLELMNREIMTWAEVGHLTNWATPVPLDLFEFNQIRVCWVCWVCKLMFFIKFCKFFGHYFLKQSFCLLLFPLLLGRSLWKCWCIWRCPQVSEALFIFHSVFLLSLRRDNFNWPISKFSDQIYSWAPLGKFSFQLLSCSTPEFPFGSSLNELIYFYLCF